MISKASIAALAATITLAQGHFSFARLAHNSVWHDPLRYIRNKTSPYNDTWFGQPGLPPEHWWTYPTEFVNKPESVRCGRDHMAHAANTEVLNVKAGDEIEYAHIRYEPYEWTDDMWYGCPDGRGSCGKYGQNINHPGPVVAHLSRVPDGMNVTEYDGSGDWTKIYSLGLEWREGIKFPVFWLAYNEEKTPVPRFVVKIPPQTPSGQYLLRVDLIWAYWAPGGAQLYPSCTQISISGNINGDLPAGVKIPEIFSPDSPGMTISRNMSNRVSIDADYTYPGGRIWDGQNLAIDKPAYASRK